MEINNQPVTGNTAAESPAHRAPDDQASPHLRLELTVRDPEVIREITAYPEGRMRQDFAGTCLKIGVLALKQAEGQIDAHAVRNEGEKLLESMRTQLDGHREKVTEQVTATLKDYFDPKSGRFQERISALLANGGELEKMLRAQVGGEDSTIARTLAQHLGENSPIFKMLSPSESEGILRSLTETTNGIMATEREKILRQFTMDDESSALSRLVKQLNEHNVKTTGDLTKSINEVIGEFSLDKEDSALSRLVRQVESAQKKISAEFTLDSEVSALARIKKELVGVLDAHKEQNQRFQQDVLEQLTALKTRKETSAKSTLHGNDFEAAVFELIADASTASGDIATATGNTTGLIKHSKVGDAVVEIGGEHIAAGAKIVIEAKDSNAYDLRKALTEIETARKNRDAGIGVFVFSATTAPDGIDGLQRFGQDIVCVWDMEDPATDTFPRAALSVAKALSVQIGAVDEESQVDLTVVDRAIRNIEKQVNSLDQIKKLAETVRGHGQKIVDKADTMTNHLTRDIESLDREVATLKQEKSHG